jgi:hypothetical protein
VLKENNVRKGFVIPDQYTLLRDALPDYLKPVLAMGYLTGMQTRAVFDRYNIVNERDLKDAALKLSQYLAAEFGHSTGIGRAGEGKRARSDTKPTRSRIRRKDWLGGLDSNQDSQIQSLESYRLDDLPAVENSGLTSCHGLKLWVKRVDHTNGMYCRHLFPKPVMEFPQLEALHRVYRLVARRSS